MSGDKKKYTYYPGCSSQGSGLHLDESLRAVAPVLDMELVDIEDWNCCGASVGHIGGGQLPNLSLTGRNLAKAVEQGTQDVLTGCAACYLNTHAGNEKIKNDVKKRQAVNEALAAGGLEYNESLQVRHVCEVFVNDVGVDKIKEKVTNPLTGLKVAGYVGCQTVRPFAATEGGGKYDTHDRPAFLDDFTEACGAEAVEFATPTNCCGGSVAVMSPDRTLHLIKDILQAAKDAGADAISTPCPLCQTNVEMYQAAINKEFGT
ncbi:MAG: CoB--CoM heterodisulfide reductase iron-sulfur subunit B family protein, partial [Hyphomicrobiales bacterium]|nr:CoB--CoM heterodisulfide reductase iron-sulfur subunit B family protein [Hyphomicrobiales bacterium]